MPGGPKTRIEATNAGAKLLLALMKEKKWSQNHIARWLQWSSPKLNRILSGKVEPTVREAFAIEKLTEGNVPAKAWTVDLP